VPRAIFALQKSTTVELTCRSQTKGIGYLRHCRGASIVRVESRCCVPNVPSQQNSRGINVRTRTEVNLRRTFLDNLIDIARQTPTNVDDDASQPASRSCTNVKHDNTFHLKNHPS
jgi:hypothetical protein